MIKQAKSGRQAGECECEREREGERPADRAIMTAQAGKNFYE